jgi:two-component system chemotaxis response regulator CheB
MMKTVKVLVVDDSAFAVASISRKLQIDPDIEVIDSARNGKEAVEKARSLSPDVITMDVVMPEMDGLSALERIMVECPTPVVMLSALTSENAEATIRALELGAVDFFLKPSVVMPAGDAEVLLEKIKSASRVNLRLKRQSTGELITRCTKSNSIKRKSGTEKIIVIGSSTGGPRALMQLIPALPPELPAGILIVQHMPPLFTRSLAERLNQASKLRVAEAQEGDSIWGGKILLAPGDYHMTLSHNGKVSLNQGPRLHGIRPSVDVTMKSAASIFGALTLGIILTGMGSDGTEGAFHIKAAGGKVIAEDESTCVVYGMPQSVAKAGYVDKVLPLHEIASELSVICNADSEAG